MITTVIKILVMIPCLIHVYIMFLEMKLWEKKRIRQLFGLSEELAKQTRMMAFNQGLYNGFLAVGLIWSFLVTDPAFATQIQMFFLGCIAIAGIVGALTIVRRIFWIQALPALVPLIFILISNGTI